MSSSITNKFIFTLFFGALAMTITHNTYASSDAKQAMKEGKFVNSEIEYKSHFSGIFKIAKAYMTTERLAPEPNSAVPVLPLTKTELLDLASDTVFRLGHSTILMKIDGKFILIDPVFSERASPVQWAGPKRFHQSPISIADLPDIDAVIISHDHYDHLDKAAIKALDSKVTRYLTPLKVGDHLIDWGVKHDKIIEHKWWQTTTVDSLSFTATPTQHFSGRGVFDRDLTLWASWVIKGTNSNLFFSGDSGYFQGFKEIGEKFGPFDITFIETGAYNEMWSEIHMLPQESMQAHLDLKGEYMMPIHNGTFDLALHDWFEPFKKINDLANENDVNLLTPVFGQAINVEQLKTQTAKHSVNNWWQEMMIAQQNELGSDGKQTPLQPTTVK